MAGEVELSPWPSPQWVRHMGFDDNCSDLCPGYQSCAWFVWEDDQYTDVNWRAVCPDGTMSVSGALYLDGHQPSGDSAMACVAWWQGRCIQWERRKLLAWISEDRLYVNVVLLYDNGQVNSSSQRTIAVAGANRLFYQTAVAWSSNENRWLVSWTDALASTSGGGFGHAYSTWIDFNGNWRPSGNVTLMQCDAISDCPQGGATSVGAPNTVMQNSFGACKGIWLASSYYSNATDRYRFMNYSCQRRIDADGVPAATMEKNGCITYCPITEANYSHSGYSHPFQMLVSNGTAADHWHLRLDSYGKYSAGSAFDSPYNIPQGFRSNGFVAAALSASKFVAAPSPSDLALTVVDLYQNPYCPL